MPLSCFYAFTTPHCRLTHDVGTQRPLSARALEASMQQQLSPVEAELLKAAEKQLRPYGAEWGAIDDLLAGL